MNERIAQTQPQTTASTHTYKLALPHTALLQRSCACGGKQSASEECPECQKKRQALQRRATNSDAPALAPPVVHEVLRAPGQSLHTETRARMEARFGHDFSRVRIHTDARAAESARAVNAFAYTVGRDVVFDAGSYAPETEKGRRLLAHELTHVIQQASATPARNDSPLEIGAPDDTLEHQAEAMSEMRETSDVNSLARTRVQSVQRTRYSMSLDDEAPRRREYPFGVRRGSTLPRREALALIDCTRIMGEENSPYCRQEVLGERPPPPTPAPLPAPCSPSQPLTWANFTGTPSGTHSAWTSYDYAVVTTGATPAIEARFAPSRSWVRPQFGNPTDRNLSGCANHITQCESFFPPGSTGGSFALNSTPSTTCPAASRPTPGIVASSLGDCGSVIATECDRVALLESNRLLHHEQLHFDIACALANKGNIALRDTPGAVPQTILAGVQSLDRTVVRDYDSSAQTDHGCNASSQASWDADVAAGLPTRVLP